MQFSHIDRQAMPKKKNYDLQTFIDNFLDSGNATCVIEDYGDHYSSLSSCYLSLKNAVMQRGDKPLRVYIRDGNVYMERTDM